MGRPTSKEPAHTPNGFLRALGRHAVLIVAGTAIGLGMVEWMLRANPHWVPSEVRVDPPVRRVRAFEDEAYTVKLSNGDLFHWMRGELEPLSAEQDRVLARVHLTTDAHGFRNSPPEKAAYDIVALGDSFTVAKGVASPWPQRLADTLGADVLNLGEAGAGPQQELGILRQYGLNKRPRWVILAFFSGNDLYDAAAYAQANPFIVARLGRHLLARAVEAWQAGGGEAAAPAPSGYRYPIAVSIGGSSVEMAFFSAYIAWSSASGEAIEASRNYQLVRETILDARDLSEAAGARFLLVYVPSKAEVYLPYVDDADTLARVLAGVPALELDDAGFLRLASHPATPELVGRHLGDQARALAGFAAEKDLLYLDLTPAFREAAGEGAELYYPFDTHWNQRGHDLAARTIAQSVGGPGAGGSNPAQR